MKINTNHSLRLPLAQCLPEVDPNHWITVTQELRHKPNGNCSKSSEYGEMFDPEEKKEIFRKWIFTTDKNQIYLNVLDFYKQTGHFYYFFISPD